MRVRFLQYSMHAWGGGGEEGCIPRQYLTFLAWYEVEIRTNDTRCKMMTNDDAID